MGKYLIIKDADFSANAVETIDPSGKSYFYGITDEQFTTLFNNDVAIQNGGYTDKNSKVGLRGLNLLGIRTKISQGGLITFLKTNFDVVNGIAVDNTMITELFTINVVETGIQDIMFPNIVVLGENECLVVGKTTDTALYNYGTGGSEYPFYSFFGKVRVGGTTSTNTAYMLGIDFIYR